MSGLLTSFVHSGPGEEQPGDPAGHHHRVLCEQGHTLGVHSLGDYELRTLNKALLLPI